MALQHIHSIKSVLIIAGPGIGDTFLATPIVAALRAENPEVVIDFLVRKGRGGYLQQCSEVRHVLEWDYQHTISSYLAMMRSIWRSYDLAISTMSSDRAVLSCFYAAKQRCYVVPPRRWSSFWKYLLASAWVLDDGVCSISVRNAKLIESLGLAPRQSFLFPSDECASSDVTSPAAPYVVIHPLARGPWKSWTEDAWLEVIASVKKHGREIVLIGGSGDYEREYARILVEKGGSAVHSYVGKTDFSELVSLVKGADLFIGIDSVAGHLAAQLEIPGVLVFGPTSSLRWAPIPHGSFGKACFSNVTGIERQDNVTICKAACECPGARSHCFQHEAIEPKCLQEMETESVLTCIEEILVDKTLEQCESK